MNSSPETITTNEGQANNTASVLEQFVKHLLADNGYTPFPLSNESSIIGKQYVTLVPPGMEVYESPPDFSFLIINQDKFPEGLIIECKWQQTVDSADEKHSYVAFNTPKIDIPTIILLDSNGHKKTTLARLKNQVGKKTVIGVYNMSEFQELVSKGFLA